MNFMNKTNMFVENNGKSDFNGFNIGELNYDKYMARTLNLWRCIFATSRGMDFKSHFLDFVSQRVSCLSSWLVYLALLGSGDPHTYCLVVGAGCNEWTIAANTNHPHPFTVARECLHTVPVYTKLSKLSQLQHLNVYITKTAPHFPIF